MLEIQSKTCRKCGETKPLSAFYGKSRIGDFPKSSAGFSSNSGKAIKYLNKHFNHGSASAQVAHDADLNGGLADEESVHQGRVIQ